MVILRYSGLAGYVVLDNAMISFDLDLKLEQIRLCVGNDPI